MTKKKILLAIAAAAGMATTSQAQGISFDGAYVQGEIISNYTAGAYGYSQTGVYGAVQASVGRFALQVDVGIFGYDSDPLDSIYYAVHAMYRFSPKLVVGAYYGQDNFYGTDTWNTYGIEAKFNPSFAGERFTFEAMVGAYEYPTFGGANLLIGLGVEYAVTDRIDLGLSYLRGAWPDLGNPADRYDVLELEATYTFGSGLFSTASYTNTFSGANPDWDEATFGIAIGYNFGSGTTFDRRGYSSLYPGD